METGKLKPYKITKGNTYKEILTLNKNGEPLSLSDYTEIKMDIRKGESDTSPLLFSVSLTGGNIAVSGTDNNILTITISKTDTAKWERNQYYRDIKFTNSENEDYTMLEGIVTVRQNIT